MGSDAMNPSGSEALNDSTAVQGSSELLELSDKQQLPDKQLASVDTGQLERLDPSAAVRRLAGWRFTVVVFIMCLGLFLSTVETSITATALVSIGHYFNNSVTTTWVVLSYLLSYMGFSVIIARLSDGVGRKFCTIFCWVLFAGFSLASGLSRSLDELIVFRAIQGIGGSGLFSLALIVLPEIAPKKLWGLMSTFMGISLACSYIVGPVLGGVITQRASWRWIYLFNAPAAVVAVALLLIAWPRHPTDKSQIRPAFFAQMDIPGALLLLIASVLLVFAIQEAGALKYKWNSAAIVVSLVISGISWCAFIAWTSWLNSAQTSVQMKSIFPLSAALQRPTGPAILMTFLAGFPFFIVIINLPLRFQLVNGDTPLMAGVRLIPMLGISAFGSTLGGVISSKRNLTSPSVITGACFLLLGSGLLSTISRTQNISPSQYGYQILFGFGTGISFSSSALMTTLSNTYDKVASLQGAIGQARVLGGSLGLAIATIIFNHHIAKDLPNSLSPTQLSNLQQSITTIYDLDPQQQIEVAKVFASSFNQQMRICTYLSAVALVVALFTWQKNPASVEDSKTEPTLSSDAGEP